MPSSMEVDTGETAGGEETKGGEGSVAAAAAAAGGGGGGADSKEGQRNVLLHPLAIINICDHYTRVSTGGGQGPKDGRIIGLLFGLQQGLDVHIFDSAETRVEESGESVTLVTAAVQKQKELFEAVYPLYEIIGWYSVGEEVKASDIGMQRQMFPFNESPLFMLLNPKPVQGAKELPVLIHEAEVHVVDAQPALLFVPLPFQLETAQAEQISVEHVAKATPADPNTSVVDTHTDTVATSLRTLLNRIRVLKQFLRETEQGGLPPDYRLLREMSSLCNQLPVLPSGDEFALDVTDSLAVTFMATVQTTTAALHGLTEKFGLVSRDKGKRGCLA